MTIEIKGSSVSGVHHAKESSDVKIGRGEVTVQQEATGKSEVVSTVSITETAEKMRTLENTVSDLPVVDTQRVEDIKRAISEGSYQIDVEKTAGMMLSFETEIL